MGDLEDVLGQLTTNTDIIKKLIQTISSPDVDYRSKITIILKTLQHQLRNADIQQWMLEILELYEQLLFRSKRITTVFKSAYCAIAVDCTLRYLTVLASRPNYEQAVQTIWLGRVHHIEMSWESELFSDELENWKDEIMNAFMDPRVMKKLACITDTRHNALHKLDAFLAEAWDNLGPAKDFHVTVNDSRVIASLIKGKSIDTVDAERMDATISYSKINSMPIDEVPNIVESPQCSSAVLENHEIEDMNQEAQLENNSSDTVDVPISQSCQNSKNNKANHKKTTSAHQSDVHHPSLMEPNCTARTHEWNDSIGLQGGTSDTSKISLPSPERRKLPPLKKYKPKRKKRTWSKLEEDNLRAGVKAYVHVWFFNQ
ncbi:hypothetical protein TSUD_203970 [Trifolium subterraneum]|uniref:Uncharacterized protein n=1 Tax=Trifolium subterraneum TaxID=3900 RepID=A0A2Z6LLT0_TRISU|nr:hypothetical protein TSUD_203970 [Trifolium subterraneum]